MSLIFSYTPKTRRTTSIRTAPLGQPTKHYSVFSLLVMVGVVLSLSACQSTLRQIKDCKVGDWSLIGNKDGTQGLPANFAERREFCEGVDSEKIKTESAGLYQVGWEAGNHQFWYKLGQTDGAFPRTPAYFEAQLQSKLVLDKKTPSNRPAYQAGWVEGNASYWRSLGDQDGVAGLAASHEQQRLAQAGEIPFNADAYKAAWQLGNQAYWTRLGFLDAQQGVSDQAFAQHAASAQARAVLVRQDAYQLAWDKEIVEYWKRTAWADATQGWDRYMRRVDAKKRNLKFVEDAYQTMWEQRLQAYWRDAGRDDGFGHAQRLEERIANARNDKVFVLEQTKEIYLQAWQAENARYCSPENAFQFGRDSRYFEWSVCVPTQQARARHAYENGQQFQLVWRDRERVERDIREAVDYREELESQLRRLDKESRKDQAIIKDNKDKQAVDDAVQREKRREQERHTLSRRLRDAAHRLDDLESRRHRLEQRLSQLQRSI